MLPLASWHRGFGPRDNRHPWAPRTCADILDDVTDPIARQYLKISAHSDMATEPHLTNGLIGLRNFLKSVPGYGAQYSIEGGMEMLPRALAASLRAPTWSSTLPVVQVSRNRDERYIGHHPPRQTASRSRTSMRSSSRCPTTGCRTSNGPASGCGARWRRMSRTTIGPATTCASRSCSTGRSGVTPDRWLLGHARRVRRLLRLRRILPHERRDAWRAGMAAGRRRCAVALQQRRSHVDCARARFAARRSLRSRRAGA